MRTFVVAEVGPNHNGSADRALGMIDALSKAGADAVKFQLARPEMVYSADAFKADYQAVNDGAGPVIEMSRRNQLSRDDHKRLYDACRRAGVAYMCTAFDLDSLEFLDRTFDLPYFKVPSGEILSVDMLEYMAGRGRPILLSTGMATLDDIGRALGVLESQGSKDITILHCVSCYPAAYGLINLNVMKSLASRFGRPIGYSDHTQGPECCLAAVAMGACVVEKHVTPDRDLPGPDHKASATVDEFAALVASIRRIEESMGDGDKKFSEEESAVRRMARKSVVTVRAIEKGEVIARRDVCFKRPGIGIAPIDIDTVVGRTVRRPIDADRVIRREDLESA